MAIDPDATPPGGIREEIPTSPDLAQGLRCPECRGERYVLTCVETDETGALEHASAEPCTWCKAAGSVDRATFRRWHARTQGRPDP